MALLCRRRLPLVLGPLVLGLGFHAARHQLVANESSGSAPSLLNPAQVSAKLRAHEEGFSVDRGNGVLRYDTAQLASNNPCEDDHSERVVSVPLVTPGDVEYLTDWHFWGIYDGHGGSSTSAKLREALVSGVVRELNKLYEPVAPGSPNRLEPAQPELVDAAVARAFVKLDHEIVHESVEKLLANPTRQAAIQHLPPALSGACALLAFYDTATRNLRVALTGDSRAVLGVRSSGGQWQAKALSADQTGSNEDEARRIRSEHPQSEKDTCVRRGRVLGIYEPTRSFGDAAVKWSRETQRKIADLFFGTRVPSYLRTPPYMTAEPVVTRAQLDPEQRPCFLVLASDGVFELLSNDQVVGLVVDWLQQRHPAALESVTGKTGRPSSSINSGDSGALGTAGSGGPGSGASNASLHGSAGNGGGSGGAASGSSNGSSSNGNSSSNSNTNSGGPSHLSRLGSFVFGQRRARNIGDPVEDITEHKEALKQPIQRQTAMGAAQPALRIAVQDTNAATHLIRNALGGADHEQVSLLLSIPPPMSRNYRDDLTVTVVFFGEHNAEIGDISGTVRTIPEATNPRAKL